MKFNLKELIKPGYIVEIEYGEEDYDMNSSITDYYDYYVVVDTMKGLALTSYLSDFKCIPLDDFDDNLIYTGVDFSSGTSIISIARISYCNIAYLSDGRLNYIWKRESMQISMQEIADKFGTTVNSIKIIDYLFHVLNTKELQVK